jgi:FkbM family methyltransferase
MISSNIIRLVKRFIYNLGYTINPVDRDIYFDIEAFLSSYLKINRSLFFIQIGACDGVTSDPIYQFVVRNHEKISGIVIEPLDDYFKELQKNYDKFPNIIPVNAAIHNTEDQMVIHRVDPKAMKLLPAWSKGIASFDLNHHKHSGIPSSAIISQMARCISLRKLLEECQVKQIDLLQIDTEGYDAEIIQNIDFDYIKPKIIRYEHGLHDGVMSKEKFIKVAELLHKNGYELIVEHYDVTAYQMNFFMGS